MGSVHGAESIYSQRIHFGCGRTRLVGVGDEVSDADVYLHNRWFIARHR